jgi:hypothetical protein
MYRERCFFFNIPNPILDVTKPMLPSRPVVSYPALVVWVVVVHSYFQQVGLDQMEVYLTTCTLVVVVEEDPYLIVFVLVA